MPHHSAVFQRAARAGQRMLRPGCGSFSRQLLFSPSLVLVVVIISYPHGFLLPLAAGLPHAKTSEYLLNTKWELGRRVSPTGLQAVSENAEPDVSLSSLHRRRKGGDWSSHPADPKEHTSLESRAQQAATTGAAKEHEGSDGNFLPPVGRTPRPGGQHTTPEIQGSPSPRDVRLLADDTPPLLENDVLYVSTILGQQDTEVTCPSRKTTSLAALFREGDAAGILKFLVDGSLDFSRWPSPRSGYSRAVAGFSAAAMAESLQEEDEDWRPSRRAAAGTDTAMLQEPCQVGPANGDEAPRKQESSVDVGERACQMIPLTGEKPDRQETPLLSSEPGHESPPAARTQDSRRRRDSPGDVSDATGKGEPAELVPLKTSPTEGQPRPQTATLSSVGTDSKEATRANNDNSPETPGRENASRTGGRASFEKAEEDRASNEDEERPEDSEAKERMTVNRLLHAPAKNLLQSSLAGKRLNLGDLVCRALSHPFVGTASFCSVLEVIRMQFICKDRSLNCSAIEAALSNYFKKSSGSSSGGKNRFSYPEIFVPEVPGTSRDSVLDLPMHSEFAVDPDDRGGNIPGHVVEAEGPSYSLIWQGLQRLYDYYDAASCKLQFAVEAAPDPLPGWTSEMVIHAVQPGSTPRSPLCLVARRAKTVLVLIRGTQTEFEWSLNAQYQLTFGWLDRWDGQVESGFSRVFAAMAPAIQVYLGILRKQGLLDRIIVAGHSLGAAVGCLLSYSLAVSYRNVDAVLFAPPRSGDRLFMEAWRRRVNGRAIKYELDPYPEVPCPRMPVCEFSGRPKGGGLAAAGLGERARGLGALMTSFVGGTTSSRSSSNGSPEDDAGYLSYADYPNSVVFGPKDLPNPQVQSPLHVKYNHSCAYTCWLAHNFNPSDPRTMCQKGKAGHTPANENYSPSRCPSLN